MDIIIIQTRVGLTIYERQFNLTSRESGLISGFMNALSSMFEAVSGANEDGIQSYEAEGSIITLHRLEKSDLILISKENVSRDILDKFKKAHEYIENHLEDIYFDNDAGVEIPSEERIDAMFEENDLPISYLWPFSVDNTQVDKVFKMRLSDDKYKYYLNLITEFNIEKVEGDIFYLRDLTQFLIDRKIFRREVMRCIDFYQSYGIIGKEKLTTVDM